LASASVFDFFENFLLLRNLIFAVEFRFPFLKVLGFVRRRLKVFFFTFLDFIFGRLYRFRFDLSSRIIVRQRRRKSLRFVLRSWFLGSSIKAVREGEIILFVYFVLINPNVVNPHEPWLGCNVYTVPNLLFFMKLVQKWWKNTV